MKVKDRREAESIICQQKQKQKTKTKTKTKQNKERKKKGVLLRVL